MKPSEVTAKIRMIETRLQEAADTIAERITAAQTVQEAVEAGVGRDWFELLAEETHLPIDFVRRFLGAKTTGVEDALPDARVGEGSRRSRGVDGLPYPLRG